MRVIMTAPHRSEDGLSIWGAGTTQYPSTAYGAFLVLTARVATDPDNELKPTRGVLTNAEAQTVQALAGDGTVQLADGSVYALSEASPVVTLTATGTAFTGACEFRGVNVRAINGTPQTVTVYDNTSASGTPIATFTVSALGYFYWDGNMTTPGVGNGARRVNSTGCHVVISGGTSRTIDVDVSGV
jgi:hypothetical protein